MLITCLLGACSSAWRGTADTLKAALSNPELPDISREAVLERPYFQILTQTHDNQALLILTRVNGSYQYWQSSAGETLILANGLIMRTTRLTSNLDQTHFIGADPFAEGLQHIDHDISTTREIDLDQYRYGIKIHSTFHFHDNEKLTIIGETHEVKRIDEIISAPAIGLSATNHYWVDDQGAIWKSTQTLWPGFTVTITQLRPYEVSFE